MHILAIEPYFGLSHETFLTGYRSYSQHDVELWTLPPRKWKWRMRGSAYHFAERAAELGDDPSFDVLLVSDFLNLADFLAIAPRWARALPAALYFHENQITYPLVEHAPTDYHYGWINISSALTADLVLFNSTYHRAEFLDGVRDVFRRMPDFVPERLLDRLVDRTDVLPVGIDFTEHDRARENATQKAAQKVTRDGDGAPVILWNHRWEYDKNPDLFFRTLERLHERGLDFRLVVCGQSFKNRPAIFAEIEQRLAPRIDHFGYFENRGEYLERVAACDVIVSTAVHEFFGVSVAEAIYLGCLPVLPKRLSYPEIIPPHLHPLFLYDSDGDLERFLGSFLERPPVEYRDELREAVGKYHWSALAPELDRRLEKLAARA